MITWGNIKLLTLQKLFATNNGSTVIPTDNSTREYISAMPGAANEALQMLATAGKFIIKSIDITHIPVNNLIPNGDQIYDVECGSIMFSGENAKSIYFEVKGKGKVTYKKGNSQLEEDFDTSDSYGLVAFRKQINNPDNEKITVIFSSEYPMRVTNIAMYSAKYEKEEDIPPYKDYIRYDLSEMIPDYYMVDLEHVIFEGTQIPKYKATSDFFQEGFKVLVLPREMNGNIKLYYKAYPQSITLETPDDEVLSLDPEVAALLPLYMASQLYKDDDSGIATVYRNEFEVAFERLQQSVSAPSSEHFTSVSGWI